MLQPSKEKETIAFTSWKAKVNVIEILMLTVADGIPEKNSKISLGAMRPYSYL